MPVDVKRVQAVFSASLGEPDRKAVLDRECAGDAELRRRVESLLKAHDDSAELPAAVGGTGVYVSAAIEKLASGSVFAGRYKLREMLGEGGMGVVYVADQTEPVQRRVALKFIRATLPTGKLLARFEQERQALALMDHPNIAKVYDAGVADNTPYLVMELIKGVPITKYCDDAKLTPQQRLELFITVCQAVQHAHQKGIIHRDLKPSNIIVGLYDGRPVPKVIDFGVAKMSGPKLTEHSVYTEAGLIIGTLEYMSPEQAELNNLDIDTRSDIYALGVILYELLTGTVPFSRKDLEKAGFGEMLRLIKEQEPSRPSTKLSSSASLLAIAANRHLEPAKLTKLVRGDLDWIVMKALDKDRTRRYETANGFAMDVQRYLASEAVLATPPSAGYRFRKFVMRNKGQVIAAGLVMIALVAGIAGTSWSMWRANLSAEAERLARVEAQVEKANAEAEKHRAIKFRDHALDALRATTGEDVEKLIGAKTEISQNERDYLEAIAKRWQGFAKESGTDIDTRVHQAEGHFRVGGLWQRLGRGEEAKAELQSALKLHENLVAECPFEPTYQQRLAMTHGNLALLYTDFGENLEARREYYAARDLQVKLVELFPSMPAFRQELARTRYNLAIFLYDLGKREEAQIEFQSACKLQVKLVEQFPDVPEYQVHLARIHNSQGILLKSLGQTENAWAEYQKAHNLWTKLVEQKHDLPRHQHELAGTLINRASLLTDLGKLDDAQKEYRAALTLNKELVEQYPGVPRYRDYLARNHSNLGNLLAGTGKSDDACTEYRAACDLLKKLAAQFPTAPEYSRKLATIHDSLGTLQTNLRMWEEARADYLIAIDLKAKLSGQFPADAECQITLGGCYCNYAILFLREGRPAESLEWFDRAIRTLQPVLVKNPRDLLAREFMRNCYWSRAKACSSLKKKVEALKDWDRVVEFSLPGEQLKMRAMRAPMRLGLGLIAEAIADVSAAMESEVWTVAQWYDFACVFAVASDKIAGKKQEYANRAMELLHKAVQAGYKDAAHMKKDTDLDALRDREDFKKLIAELETKVSAVKPKSRD